VAKKKQTQKKTVNTRLRHILWALADGKLFGPRPAFSELYGFDFHPDFGFWGSVDLSCARANLELMRLLWSDHGPQVKAEWKRAALRGSPSWSKKFDVDE